MNATHQKRRSAVPIVRPLGWAAAAIIALWLLSMTLVPGAATNEINLIPFSQKIPALRCLLTVCNWQASAGRFLFIDVLGNIVVFTPLGAALALALWPSRPPRRRPSFGWPLRAGLLSGLFSLGIELAQLAVPGRATDVDDVILNTAGAWLGAVLVWLLYSILRGHHD
jgi:glycopeptide antibiotics resistance protein